MENIVNPYDKEYMRLAILKHEETFKHQVHELHRLYRIQKLLMRNIGKGMSNSSQLQSDKENNIKKLDLERPADHEDYNVGDESEIELTLGPSNYSRRRRRRTRKKLDTPLTSDHSGPSFSSSSTGSSHNRTTKNDQEDELGLFQFPNLVDYQNEKLRQDQRLKQPAPWLFQVLSLNMTTN